MHTKSVSYAQNTGPLHTPNIKDSLIPEESEEERQARIRDHHKRLLFSIEKKAAKDQFYQENPPEQKSSKFH
jgi:hypothetical protein